VDAKQLEVVPAALPKPPDMGPLPPPAMDEPPTTASAAAAAPAAASAKPATTTAAPTGDAKGSAIKAEQPASIRKGGGEAPPGPMAPRGAPTM